MIDLFSHRLLGYAMSEHHDAPLVVASLNMAAATRGGSVDGVIFHSDRGSRIKIYTWIVDFYNLRRRHSACRQGPSRLTEPSTIPRD